MSKNIYTFIYSANYEAFYSQHFPEITDRFVFFMLSSVQLLSHVRLFVTTWTVACQASLSITNFQSLLKLMSIDSVMPSNHLILCHPLLLLPSIFPSIRVFSNEPVLCIRWSKYWSFSFSISPSNEYSGLISFRMDGLDLLAVQGTVKSLLQHHSSKASILWCSAFFVVQLSYPYMSPGKTIPTIHKFMCFQWIFSFKLWMKILKSLACKCLWTNILFLQDFLWIQIGRKRPCVHAHTYTHTHTRKCTHTHVHRNTKTHRQAYIQTHLYAIRAWFF